jgi:hypothetical protein
MVAAMDQSTPIGHASTHIGQRLLLRDRRVMQKIGDARIVTISALGSLLTPSCDEVSTLVPVLR